MKTSSSKRVWIVAIVLGWLLDFLFWKATPGINFAIFAILCMLGGLYLMLADGLRPARSSLALLPFFAFFAVITFIRAESMTAFLAYTFTLFTMSVFVLTYLGGKWFNYSLADYVSRFFQLAASMIARPSMYALEVRNARSESGESKPKTNFWPVIRGIAIALPVVAIFSALLSSADAFFSQRLQDFMAYFNIENLPEYIFRMIYIVMTAYALSGIFLHASSQSKDEKLLGVDKPIVPSFLGFTESSIVLGSVVVLFALFVAIQFQYFFGGQTNINIEGYTYAEYARRGFGELVAVAFFSLLMLLGLSAITHRETESQRKIFSGLGVTLVALVLVMLVSAYQRLALYEEAYGFSRLRTYTHVFLVWIGLLLIAVIVLEILRKERAFAFAMILASFGFAISLSLLDVDAFIVNHNIQREMSGAGSAEPENRVELDAQYFVELSDDAVPALTQALRSSTLPDPVREKIGVSLACIRNQRAQDTRERPWQSFHLSRYMADQELASMKKEIDKFVIIDTDWPITILTPSGKEATCWPDYYSD